MTLKKSYQASQPFNKKGTLYIYNPNQTIIMKKVIKNTKLLLYICLAMFLLNSCTEEKEYLENNNRDLKFSRKPFKELLSFKDFNSAYQKVKSEKQRSIASRSAIEDEYNFTIVEGKDVKIVEVDNKTFYNILIERDAKSAAYFENLLLMVEKNNNIDDISAYIVKYEVPDTTILINPSTIDKDITTLFGRYTQTCYTACTPICTTPWGDGTGGEGHIMVSGCTFHHLQCSEICINDPIIDGSGLGSGGGGGADGAPPSDPSPPPSGAHGAAPPPELLIDPVFEEEVEEEEKTPCEELKELLKPNDTIIANPITIADTIKRPKLKTRIELIGSKVIYPKEYGCNFSYKRKGDVFTNGEIKGGGVNDNVNVPLIVGNFIYGGIHNHPIQGHSIPNIGDIDWVLSCHDSATVYNKNRVFSIIAVRKLGSTTIPPEVTYYALKVEDRDLLSQNIEAKINTVKPATLSRDDKIDKIVKKDGLLFDEFPNDLEKKFLEKYGNYGVGLYKVNASLTNWGKLTLDASGNVVNDPCGN